MGKRPDPELIDVDNPEWTVQQAVAARRFGDLPKTLQAKLRGRPKAASAKARLTVRVDPDAPERWRASGPGWQTRLAALVARMAPRAPV